jgi:hypothetical protein
MFMRWGRAGCDLRTRPRLGGRCGLLNALIDGYGEEVMDEMVPLDE